MLDDIKRTLSATAAKPRANMDAAEYKHLELGLIFVEYISGTFQARRTELTRRLADPAGEYYFAGSTPELPADVVEAELEDRDYYREANVFRVPEAARGEQLGLNEDEVRFYDALADNESAVRELTDETLTSIAHELVENLRKNLSVDWSARESVQARLRLRVKRILRKYRYPPDRQDAAVELVLQQAKALAEAWA